MVKTVHSSDQSLASCTMTGLFNIEMGLSGSISNVCYENILIGIEIRLRLENG